MIYTLRKPQAKLKWRMWRPEAGRPWILTLSPLLVSYVAGGSFGGRSSPVNYTQGAMRAWISQPVWGTPGFPTRIGHRLAFPCLPTAFWALSLALCSPAETPVVSSNAETGRWGSHSHWDDEWPTEVTVAVGVSAGAVLSFANCRLFPHVNFSHNPLSLRKQLY